MLFSLSLSNPTICTLTFYSLDVAAVRDEPQSYRTDRHADRCWPPVSAKPYSTVYSNIVDAGRYFTYILSKVSLQQCFRLQMRVFLLSFGPCLLYLYPEEDKAQSSIWNSSSPVWSLKYAIRFIDVFSIKL